MFRTGCGAYVITKEERTKIMKYLNSRCRADDVGACIEGLQSRTAVLFLLSGKKYFMSKIYKYTIKCDILILRLDNKE